MATECPHAIERDGCIHCSPRWQGWDIRDGFCPACNDYGPLTASTWHAVREDGTAECCACGHVHEYAEGHLEKGRIGHSRPARKEEA